MGYSPNVVIMTRNRGFRSTEPDFKVPRLFYGDYPRLRVALSHHVEVYNKQLELIERMEDWGEVVCIRPQRPMEVERICRDTRKLEALYEEGFQQGEAFCRER
jgi:predicted patatin/cPLA2 family phospholipase